MSAYSEYHWDARLDFTVTWDPERGRLPRAIQWGVFRRGTGQAGSLTIQTDPGHAAYYDRAITAWIAQCAPERDDIRLTATPVVARPAPQTEGERDHE